jgi:hypothetical protein
MKRHATFWISALVVLLNFSAKSMEGASIVTQTSSFPGTVTGTLPNQNTALEVTCTLPSISDLTAYTTSYASGGFEPSLNLYNSAGNMIAGGVTPGTSPIAKPDMTITPPQAFDAYLTASDLSAGKYTLTLTDWQLNQSITATNLSDGFTSNYGNGHTFVDSMGNVRSGSYTLAVNLTSGVATPEPATLLLAASAIAAIAVLSRKKQLPEKRNDTDELA